MTIPPSGATPPARERVHVPELRRSGERTVLRE